MGQQKMMKFMCDKCGRTELMAIAKSGDFVDLSPLKDWVGCAIADMETNIAQDRFYCGVCNVDLLRALGFTSIESYKSMVKATDDIQRREATKQLASTVLKLVTSSDNLEEVPDETGKDTN